ncbi:MAG: oxidoreductase, partial [Promethearchaeota archaeon]
IKTGYSDGTGKITKNHINFYEMRSDYLGAVIPEPLYLDNRLREIPTQIGIDNDDKLEGLKQLTDIIHKKGAQAIAHLNHPGRMANPKIPGNIFLSSTNKPCENGGSKPEQMNREDMDNIIELFCAAAIRAEKANFDIIELQFGHGYLFAQFLSPKVNDRTDEYGGKFDNRIKFPLKILDAIKNSVNLSIIARVSGDEMIPDGIILPETIQLAKILKERGVEALHVSAGTVCSTPPWFFQHMFIPKGKTWEFASKIKEQVKIPVIFVGRVNNIEDYNLLENKYHADYIAIGRGLVADPNIVGKMLGNIKSAIVPCLACAEGCLGGVKSGQGLKCLVNPAVSKDILKITTSSSPKHFAVVGGGLAGMEAALILNKRGHNIDIYEGNMLGGQFRFAALTPHKRSMGQLIPSYLQRLEEQQVQVIHKEATPEDLIGVYDGVILATGSLPKIPPIVGLTNYFMMEVLLPKNIPENKKVFIIGGGLIGVDIATALIERGNQVIIVKRTEDFGTHMEMIAKTLSLKILKEKGVILSDHTKIQKINGSTVYAERNGEQIKFENIDIFVVSTGLKSYNPLEEKLKEKILVYTIGDAKEVGDAQDAIKSGYDIGLQL